MTRKYDAVIIGGGHNGLVCAFYLARAGLKVRIVEARDTVGGAAVTEEFHPGFRNSVASYTVSLLQPKVINDMKLVDHGYRVIERPISNFLPQPDGGYLKLGGGLERTQAEFRKFSKHDADVLPAYYTALENVAEVLRGLALKSPPNIGDGLKTLIDGARQGRSLSKLSLEQQRDVLDLFVKSARTFLDSWFESEAVKAAFGFDAVVGNYASPDTPGSAYVLLHHVFGEVNGKKGAWGHAIGGMGAITEAIAKECAARGVVVETDADVARVQVEGGKAVGVMLADGREFHAGTIVSNLNPKLLYAKLVERAALDDDTAERIARYRNGSGTFRMNVALSELPDFIAAPGTQLQPHHQSGILIGPSLRYFEQAFFDAKSKEHNAGWSRAPIVELVISSTLDDTLVDGAIAPPGAHVASLFCQHVHPDADGGWDAHRDTVAKLMIDTVDAYAPNFKRSVLGYKALSPLDLEREYGLIGGDIFHGSLGLDQLFSARPLLGQGNYRGALERLYLCGSGTHPGGGVTGLPGRNAAREILRDLKRGPKPD